MSAAIELHKIRSRLGCSGALNARLELPSKEQVTVHVVEGIRRVVRVDEAHGAAVLAGGKAATAAEEIAAGR